LFEGKQGCGAGSCWGIRGNMEREVARKLLKAEEQEVARTLLVAEGKVVERVLF